MPSTIAKAKFFSLLMDGSTDQSNADNELLLVLWCDPNGKDEKVHTRISIQSLMKEACKKLVGIATDRAAANVAGNGLKGLVEKELD